MLMSVKIGDGPNIYIYIYIYTECNRRNVRDFGRVFLRSNYTDITQVDSDSNRNEYQEYFLGVKSASA